MADEVSTAVSVTPATIRINWKLLEHERVRPLWNVAAMSLGIAPDQRAVKEARSDPKFVEAYEERRKMLGRKLSIEPIEDHVTYFPDHPVNKGSKPTANRMVDVVSCMNILAKAGFKVPKKFLNLRPKLEVLGLPKNSPIQVGLGAFFSFAEGVSKKPGKDQSGRNNSVEIDNLRALIYAMATIGYGYSQKANQKEREKAVADILTDVKAAGVSGYGLSTTESIQKKLVEAAAGRNEN